MNSEFSVLSWDGVPRGRVQIDLPHSKSVLNRALILSALYPDRFFPISLAPEDRQIEDVALLHHALNHLDQKEFDFGLAGTSARFFLAFACARSLDAVVDASGRGRERPLAPLIEALRAMGARIEELGQKGHFPLRIQAAPLRSARIALDGRVSSQFATALMLIAPSLESGLEIDLGPHRVSESYIELSAQLMRQSGFSLKRRAEVWSIEAAGAAADRKHLAAFERDWSGAIYFVQAMMLGCCEELEFRGLRKSGAQGDEVLIDLLAAYGVEFTEETGGVVFGRKPFQKTHFESVWDAGNWPDLAVGWAHLAQAMGWSGQIGGLSTLNSKESPRLDALADRLSKHGLAERMANDGLRLSQGKIDASELFFDSLGDHRLAMSCAAWASKGPLGLRGSGTVAKSFPGFWVEMEKLGFRLTSGHPIGVENTKG